MSGQSRKSRVRPPSKIREVSEDLLCARFRCVDEDWNDYGKKRQNMKCKEERLDSRDVAGKQNVASYSEGDIGDHE